MANIVRSGSDPRRSAALHQALPRQDHRRQVRRQRHDRRTLKQCFRARRRAAQAGRHEPCRRARRRPADRKPAQARRQEGRVHPGHARHRCRNHGLVEMVLGGQVNKEIVNLINQHGGKAVGLTGKDGNFHPRQEADAAEQGQPGDLIDIGQVGDITQIDPSLIATSTPAPSSRSSRRSASARTARPTTSTPTSSPARSPKCSRPRSWCC
jgi:hypothetical protein